MVPAARSRLPSAGILQHLRRQVQRIRDSDVDDLSLAVADSLEPRLNEPRVGRHVQPIDAFDDLVSERGIEVDAVALDHPLRTLVAPFRLPTLSLLPPPP